MSFEIGFVYRRKDRYFLAVSETTMLTVVKGKFQETRPTSRFEVIRNISVERLVREWCTTSAEMDKATAKYLTPSIEGRIQESRDQDDLWRGYEQIRTFKKAG